MSLYREDLYLWTRETARAIREGTLDPAEMTNVAEEIEGIGTDHAMRLYNVLSRILSIFLRLKHEPGKPPGETLYGLLVEDRIELDVILGCSPSLRPEAVSEIQSSYENAWAWHRIENKLPQAEPGPCPFTLKDILGI
jgi:hypothetical protein